MGFIEDLKRRREVETEAIRQEYLKAEMISEEVRQVKERESSRIRQLVDAAKAQFDESGVKVLIDRLLSIDGLRYEEVIDWYGKEEAYKCKIILEESNPGNKHGVGSVSETSIGIKTTHDGTITFKGGSRKIKAQSKGFLGFKVEREIEVPLEIRIDKNTWKGNRDVLEDALGKVYKNPQHYSYTPSSRDQTDGGPCLSGDSFISVPDGSVPVKNLKSGDLVWTVDRFGNRVQAVIIQKTKRIVSKDHKMAHIILKDGRELIVSPGHPTIDNREIGNLAEGQILDKSQIVSVQIMSYKEKYTYDILPFGDTGGYWANNILIGSTLSNQFKQNQWHRQLSV